MVGLKGESGMVGTDKATKLVESIAAELKPPRSATRRPRRSGNINQDIYDSVTRVENKFDAKVNADIQKDNLIQLLQDQAMKDKRFLKGIIVLLLGVIMILLGKDVGLFSYLCKIIGV
jgi:hypothetical protein